MSLFWRKRGGRDFDFKARFYSEKSEGEKGADKELNPQPVDGRNPAGRREAGDSP